MKKNSDFYGGVVWLMSTVALITYGIFGLKLNVIPGIEQLIQFIENLEGSYIYIAAFVTILIEGLYIIGSFFPGSSSVLILAALSQFGGILQFIFTISAIFLGWTIAGGINILFAYYRLRKSITTDHTLPVADKIWGTWFPPFRASYEVAQVVQGIHPFKVFVSAIRVRIIACIGMGLIAFVLPKLININEFSNEEGFVTLMAVALITFVVGMLKIRQSQKVT